jgi:hypothetical protein
MDTRKLKLDHSAAPAHTIKEATFFDDATGSRLQIGDAAELVKRWNAPQHKYPVGAEVQVIGDDSPQWIDGIVTEREITETKDGTSVLWTVKAPVRGGYWKNSKPSIIRNRP